MKIDSPGLDWSPCNPEKSTNVISYRLNYSDNLKWQIKPTLVYYFIGLLGFLLISLFIFLGHYFYYRHILVSLIFCVLAVLIAWKSLLRIIKPDIKVFDFSQNCLVLNKEKYSFSKFSAIQVLSFSDVAEIGDDHYNFTCFEINFILHDGTRLHLFSSGSEGTIKSAALIISEKLQLDVYQKEQ
ncbi:hypothetical protein N9N67_07280 [Bacteriovoracaceae bacterium]|nr:hypothetical protein [Bacteriovoracaceae bacterium]